MVPVCFPSKISSTTGLREAVVYALSSVTGLVRWTDYIPVKLVASADAALEGRTDAGGFIPMDMLSSSTGLMGWVDYLPVYIDNSATDAWAITATGFIPYAASGGGSSPAFTVTMTALTNALGTVTTLAYINAGSGSLIVPDVATYRTTGAAPLSVYFDASGTSAPVLSANPFHDFEYRWDFGDETVSTWQYGAGFGSILKNEAFGPIASHSYEIAGTYTPSLQVRYDTEVATLTLPSITVTASNTQWAGTKTVCVSTDGDFTGAPAGCTQVTSSNAVTAISGNIGSGDVRILFKRGQTFTVGSSISITQQGPGYIGAWGSGAKPIFDLTTANSGIGLSSSGTPTLSDWRFVDIDFDGNDLDCAAFGSNHACNKITVLRCDMHNLKWGLVFSDDALNLANAGSYTHPIWSNFYVADNNIHDLVGVSNGSNGMYIAFERSAVLGNSVDPNNKGEHGIRSSFQRLCVFSHNTITGIPSGRAFLTLRSPNQGGASFPSSEYGTYVYSEKNYVSDNYFYGGYTTGMAGMGPINSSSDGRSRDFIWERNIFFGSATTTSMLTLSGTQATARNNLFSLQNAGTAINAARLTASPMPTDIWAYNNSLYASNTGYTYLFLVSGGSMAGSTFTFKNNLFYGPSISSYGKLIDQAFDVYATIVEAGNTPDANYATNPNFTTTPPTTSAHFKPTTGSYAIASGVAVPVWSDYFGVQTLNGTRDMGAVKH